MRAGAIILVGVVAALVTAGCMMGQSNPAAVAKASQAAESWLQSIDSANYTGSWTAAAAFFRHAVKQDQWVESMEAFRAPLGKNLSRAVGTSRYTTTMPGAPDGEYVFLQYKASFEKKKAAVESVTLLADTDGVWRVSGYFIK